MQASGTRLTIKASEIVCANAIMVVQHTTPKQACRHEKVPHEAGPAPGSDTTKAKGDGLLPFVPGNVTASICRAAATDTAPFGMTQLS